MAQATKVNELLLKHFWSNDIKEYDIKTSLFGAFDYFTIEFCEENNDNSRNTYPKISTHVIISRLFQSTLFSLIIPITMTNTLSLCKKFN